MGTVTGMREYKILKDSQKSIVLELSWLSGWMAVYLGALWLVLWCVRA